MANQSSFVVSLKARLRYPNSVHTNTIQLESARKEATQICH